MPNINTLPEVRLAKGLHGWRAETCVELERIDTESVRVLKIVTMKRSSGELATRAHAGVEKGNFFTSVMFSEFTKVLEATRPARVTSKTVEAQHIGLLGLIPELKAEAIAFYAAAKA